MRSGWMRQCLCVLLSCGSMALGGCAGTRAHRSGLALIEGGQVDAGLQQLADAVRLEPRDAQFRVDLLKHSSDAVLRYLTAGDKALALEHWEEAEIAYDKARGIDGDSARVRQRFDVLMRKRNHQGMLADVEKGIFGGSYRDLTEAVDRLRSILIADPADTKALALQRKIDDLLQSQKIVGAKLGPEFSEPIAIELRDASLRTIFELIAKLTSLSFYFDKEVKADVRATVQVKDASVEDVMRMVLVSNQLEWKVLNERSVFIYPGTNAKQKEYQTLMVRSLQVINADVKAVVNSIKTIVKTKDVVFDERVGIIIIRDTPQAVRLAERVVALQDIPDPEVMLEVEVLEIKRNRLMELGFQWPGQFGFSPLPGAGGAVTVASLSELNGRGIQASVGSLLVNARKSDQDSTILANPRIRVRNKEKAKILIGDKVPVITSTSTATGFTSESINYLDVGLKLEVEPNIYADGDVSIRVNLEVSNQVRDVVSKTGALSYQIGTRGATTTLRLRDGETQVLAGLISDEDRVSANKIPGFGEIPLLGRLFGSQKDEAQRNEILLSITPRIVRPLPKSNLGSIEFESGTEMNIGGESMRLPMISVASGDLRRVRDAAIGSKGQDSRGFIKLQGPAQVSAGEAFEVKVFAKLPLPARKASVLLAVDADCLELSAVADGGVSDGVEIEPVNADGRFLIRRSLEGKVGGFDGELIRLKLNAKSSCHRVAGVQVLAASADPLQDLSGFPVDWSVKVFP